MQAEIDQLLMEVQRSKLTERRTEPRRPFARPVHIHVQREPGVLAFAKDMSKQGIGIITNLDLDVGTMAVLKIHSTSQSPVHLRCELRWSDQYGKDWFQTGWKFIAAAAPPAS
ncbi:MAG: PilZ domain-containing protein [Fuerstiella sp.]|nr:PilZ domain-containing protein [Fuerstiella sp.]MCP4787195.1 PilZ domain-containing protein [Fuerstiella sp.]MCP4855209.1 PilZ domain-containing protein [Fuerstiella sp.]